MNRKKARILSAVMAAAMALGSSAVLPTGMVNADQTVNNDLLALQAQSSSQISDDIIAEIEAIRAAVEKAQGSALLPLTTQTETDPLSLQPIKLTDTQTPHSIQISDKMKAQIAAMTAASENAQGSAEEPSEAPDGSDAQTETYNVDLISFNAAKKIPVIKAVRVITGLGLGEAKALVEAAPTTVKEGLSKEDAEKAASELEAAGAEAEIVTSDVEIVTSDGDSVTSEPTVTAAAGTYTATVKRSVSDEETEDYVINLISYDPDKKAKVKVVSAVKKILNSGLLAAKNIVETSPKEITRFSTKEEAEDAVKVLLEAGASVELIAPKPKLFICYDVSIVGYDGDIYDHNIDDILYHMTVYSSSYIREALSNASKDSPILVLSGEPDEAKVDDLIGRLRECGAVVEKKFRKAPKSFAVYMYSDDELSSYIFSEENRSKEKALDDALKKYTDNKCDVCRSVRKSRLNMLRIISDVTEEQADEAVNALMALDIPYVSFIGSKVIMSEAAAEKIQPDNDWTEKREYTCIKTKKVEKTPGEYNVTLDSFNAAKKIAVIKAVREITGLGLGEAKALVEGAPEILMEGVSKERADEIVQMIEAVGGKASYPINSTEYEEYEIVTTIETVVAYGKYKPADSDDKYEVTLDSFDAAKKIAVIKAVREITGLGLGEAKALVEGAPKTLMEGVSKEDADDMIKKIEISGGKASKK